MQKLYVFASSRRDTKKSSNGSLCYCTRFLRSTISLILIWPGMLCFNSCYDAGDFVSLFCAESEIVDWRVTVRLHRLNEILTESYLQLSGE